VSGTVGVLLGCGAIFLLWHIRVLLEEIEHALAEILAAIVEHKERRP
jgi:hypothetical protein